MTTSPLASYFHSLARTVAIKLDAVLVRIAQIERFAHAMIARPVERNFRLDHAPQGIREEPTGRIQDRGVIEAGGAGRGRLPAEAFPGIDREMMVIVAGGHEHGAAALPRHLEPQNIAVEAERALEVGDLEMDMADPHARIDDFGRLTRHDTPRAISLLIADM